MKKFLLLFCALFSFAWFAQAETLTLSGVKFIAHKVQVKDLKNGAFEILIPPAKGWPMVHVYPADMPEDKEKLSVTIQQTAPSGRLPKRLRLQLEPPGCSEVLQLAPILKDNKAQIFELEARAGKKMTHFSIAAHEPDQEIKLIVSAIKVSKINTKKQPVKPLPQVMFKGKPIFPISAWDFIDTDRESGYFIDPGLLAAGFNMAEAGVIGLPGHPRYEKHRQPVLFAHMEKVSRMPEYAHIAWIVSISYEFYMDTSQAKNNDYFVPLSGAELKRRIAILNSDLQKLRKYDSIVGYQISEPENVMYDYYCKHFKDKDEKVKDLGLSCKMVEWTKWLNEAVRKHHPEAKLMHNMGWWTTYLNAASMYDVNFPNSYAHPDDIAQVNYDAAKAVAAARIAGNGKTVVYMPAMFDNLKGRTIYNRAQVRYACFTPITRGAMGIYGWRLLRCSQKYRDRVLYPTLRELSNLSDYFLGSWHDELVTSDHDRATVEYLQKFQERVREVDGKEDAPIIRVKDGVPDVTYCLRFNKKNGKYLLLVTNNRRETVNVNFTVDLSDLPPVFVDALDYHQVRVKNNKFTDEFAPHAVHAYIIEPVKKGK